jgi:hypothetical protein
MSELTDYFVRHYTLVLDNEQGSSEAVNEAAREVVAADGVTLAEYKALSTQERNHRFAAAIGDRVIDLIAEWFDAIRPEHDSTGWLLATEVMQLGDSQIQRGLGEHYMPEDDDMENVLDEDDEDDEDDEEQGA